MRVFTASLFSLVLAAASVGPAPGMAEEITVSHGISAFGDLKYPADFPHFDYVNPKAPKGGTLRFRGAGASQTFDSLNLFILKGEPAQGLDRLHDALLLASADEPDSAYGLIAESLEYPPSREWVIFNLRPEAKFSDGTPITAEDVVFTFETLKSKGSPVFVIRLQDVARVEALDPQRVRFTFRDGAATRDLARDVGLIPILPQHYYEEVEFDQSTLVPPVSSGLFRVERADAGRSITYCRDPDYWGLDLPVNVGRYNFNCVVYEYFTDNTAAFEAFKAANYTFHEEFTSALWATNYDFPALEQGWVLREEIGDDRPSGTQGFWLNLRREKLQDVRTREAISLLFNFEWANETLFYGLYSRTDSFWENSSMQAEGLPEGNELALLEPYRGQLPDTVFSKAAYTPPVNGAQQADRRALRRASRLLDEAGWVVGNDGMRRNAAGELLTIELVDDNPAFERIALPFVQNMRRAGIDAQYTLIDSAQMQERQENYDYDVAIARLVMSMSPSIELRTLFGSEGATSPGTFNLAGVADPVVDALIETAVAAETREELETAVRAIDRVLRAKHIWVPNWFKGSHWIAYWDIFGRPAEKPPFARGDDYWWFDQAKYDALVAAGALR